MCKEGDSASLLLLCVYMAQYDICRLGSKVRFGYGRDRGSFGEMTSFDLSESE